MVKRNHWFLKLTTIYLIFIPFIGCESNEKTHQKEPLDPMKNYEWRVTESAPQEYVVTILSGYFEAANGASKGIPTGPDVDLGWGEGRSNMSASQMPAPNRFELTWFSFREDTFYFGDFSLPNEHIQTLLEQDRHDPFTLREKTANRLKLGLAPEGFLVV